MLSVYGTVFKKKSEVFEEVMDSKWYLFLVYIDTVAVF